jgi:hypothetical protein
MRESGEQSDRKTRTVKNDPSEPKPRVPKSSANMRVHSFSTQSICNWSHKRRLHIRGFYRQSTTSTQRADQTTAKTPHPAIRGLKPNENRKHSHMAFTNLYPDSRITPWVHMTIAIGLARKSAITVLLNAQIIYETCVSLIQASPCALRLSLSISWDNLSTCVMYKHLSRKHAISPLPQYDWWNLVRYLSAVCEKVALT